MKKIFFMLLISALISLPAAAEVFKCKLASGKIIYQSRPCSSEAISQKTVEIKKLTPRQLEEAQNKLKAWQEHQAAEEAEKIKADKERQQELDRQQAIDALNRNTIAQQQQAIAAQRQAEALERQHIRYNSIYALPPPRY